MKKRIKYIFAFVCVFSLCVGMFSPYNAYEVKASTNSENDSSWWDKVIEYFKNSSNYDPSNEIMGAIASKINGGSWFDGYLMGSILGGEVDYYAQPDKIFDKVASAYQEANGDYDVSTPNTEYYYYGLDNSRTNTLQVFKDCSNYDDEYYNYQWYNPVTNNYNYTNNFYYSYDYNTYYYNQTINNYQYDYYYVDNSTYVTYYIVETDSSGNENDYYYEMYYQLPDGRNSYNLTASDVWGTYFIYNVDRYASVAEDDGTTLGLWHFDNSMNDESYWNNKSAVSQSLTYSSSGVFGSAKYVGDNITLYLNNSGFHPSEPFTLEWYGYYPNAKSSYTSSNTEYYYYSGLLCAEFLYAGVLNNEWVHYALCYDGTDYSFYRNGVNVGFKDSSVLVPSSASALYTSVVSGFYFYDNSIVLSGSESMFTCSGSGFYYMMNHQGAYIDEMRLSKGVLYTDSFSPTAEPFTTNTVLVVPEGTRDNSILLYSNYDITDYRIGGARQTYPSNGSVYIALDDKDVVISVQQYQVNQWVEVEARVYSGGKTVSLNGYDMSVFKVTEGSDSSGGGSSNDSNSGSSNDSNSGGSDDSSNGGLGDIFDSLVDVVGGLFSGLTSVVAKLLSGISDLITSLFDSLDIFTTFSSGFVEFLTSAFSFIPSEIWGIISAGLTLVIIATIIKFLRG